MTHRPVDARIESGGPEDEEGTGEYAPPKDFKEAMARWATGVSIVAVRDPDDGRVHATTVGSVGGVSADPPRVIFSLGSGAQVLPFLREGRTLVVNILSARQRRLASVYTDPYPVGPSPFPEAGPPVIPGSHVIVTCRVERIIPVNGSHLILAGVAEARTSDDEAGPLIYYHRAYRELT